MARLVLVRKVYFYIAFLELLKSEAMATDMASERSRVGKNDKKVNLAIRLLDSDLLYLSSVVYRGGFRKFPGEVEEKFLRGASKN